MSEPGDDVGQEDGHDDERREFLKTAGKFAATVPPAMTFLLTTTLSSNAIAQSNGAVNKSNGDTATYEPNRADWSR